jgi:hypothetical protein
VVEAIRHIQTADKIDGLTPWKTEELIRRGSEGIRQYVTEGYIKHLGSVTAIAPEELHPDRLRR